MIWVLALLAEELDSTNACVFRTRNYLNRYYQLSTLHGVILALVMTFSLQWDCNRSYRTSSP